MYLSICIFKNGNKNFIICTLLPVTDYFVDFALDSQNRRLTQIAEGHKYLVWQLVFCKSQEPANLQGFVSANCLMLNSVLWLFSLNIRESKASHSKIWL